MAKVKGITFADVQSFVRSRGGEEAYQRLRAALSNGDCALLDEVVAVGWYDLAAQQRIMFSIPKALGGDWESTAREYARFCAERHVAKVYRVLFVFANPALILEKSGEYWSRFYDNGTWTVTRHTPHSARGELRDFALPSHEHCTFLRHYLEALFERVGAKEVRGTHPTCRVRGDATCTFHVDWR